ncbi:MAG: hypothetical protein M3082_20025 [Candidatus Dormibacteraeota bacterium]|nr:hypothetical protein [Candidatus Dormibacteraeota bacterium]
MNLAESTQRDLVEAADTLLAEVERWAPDDWQTACEVHGETSDAMHLVLHIASRCRHVTAIVREQSESRLVDTDIHFQLDPTQSEAEDATAALKQAREDALEVVRRLNEKDIQRLHEAEIDGEPDVLLASCGLIGHWRFHLQAVHQIRPDA